MANNNDEKPRDKGIGEYTRDFIKGLAGRDDDPEPQPADAAQSNASTHKKEEEKPWDRGIIEYTRDFVKGLAGHDDEPDAPSTTAAKAQEHTGFGGMVESAREAAAKAEQEKNQHTGFGGVAEAAREAAEKAQQQKADAVRKAAARAEQQKAASTASTAHDIAEAARNAAAEAKSHAAPSTSGLSDAERDELNRLRDRVKDLDHNAPAAAAPTQRRYTVQPGDSLRAIAQRFYGDEMKWKRIYEANRDSIHNPDLINVGQDFVIPE